MSSGKLITGILAGIAAGALLGILFAPDKGDETRKKISKKGNDLTDSLKKRYDDFAEDISQKLHKGKEKAESMKAEANNAFS